MTGFGWLLLFCAMALGFGLMAILQKLPPHSLATSSRVIATLLPALAWLAFGVLDGCVPIPPGERCYYFGMGTVVFAPFVAAWIVGSLGAALLLRTRR